MLILAMLTCSLLSSLRLPILLRTHQSTTWNSSLLSLPFVSYPLLLFIFLYFCVHLLSFVVSFLSLSPFSSFLFLFFPFSSRLLPIPFLPPPFFSITYIFVRERAYTHTVSASMHRVPQSVILVPPQRRALAQRSFLDLQKKHKPHD